MTSGYHDSKFSGSQQSFLTETAICIVERWNKIMGYRFVPECNHAQDSDTCQYFSSFFFSHFCKTTGCRDPEILLPWQRDVITPSLFLSFSPL